MSSTRIVYLVDTSGSMSSHISLVSKKLQETENAITANGRPVELALCTFDNELRALNWNGLSKYIQSGGGTELYRSCTELLQRLSSEFSGGDKIMVVVITDGMDNSSYGSDCTRLQQAVASEVSLAEDVYGWDFLFVGTNQNAYEVGSKMGVKTTKALSFAATAGGFDHMLDSLKDISIQWLNNNIGHSDSFFSQEVRDTQAGLGAIKFE